MVAAAKIPWMEQALRAQDQTRTLPERSVRCGQGFSQTVTQTVMSVRSRLMEILDDQR